MSILVPRSPPQSPTIRNAAKSHRRSSTNDTIIPKFAVGSLQIPAPYSSASASTSRIPASPTSSRGSGGSPQQFYSPALTSFSDAAGALRDLKYVEMNDKETGEGDDLGDRTITLQEATPQKRATFLVKNKQRANGPLALSVSPILSNDDHDGPYESEEAADATDDSKRIEQNLRRWADKEKLRRAKTRSRPNLSIPPQPSALVNDSMVAVSGLARRLSGIKRNSSVSNSGVYRKGSVRLSGTDPSTDDVDEVELGVHIPQRPDTARRSWTSPSPSSPVAGSWPEKPEGPARTGSRFIEDLDDAEVRPILFKAGHQPNHSYADLHSNPNTPLTSPTKSNSSSASLQAGRDKHRVRSHDNGTNSITSVSSFQTVDSDNKDVLAGSIMPYRPDTAHGSMTSPTGSTGRQYYSDPDHVTMRLVHSLRASGDYPEQGQLHGDYEEHDEGGTVDYGFGPLWLVYANGDLSRCNNISFSFGGGFAPYGLASVNAADKTTTINLTTHNSASWQVAVTDGSHVAFNLTDRAGATVQTPFLNVKGGGNSCGNDTQYTAVPKSKSGAAGRGVDGRLASFFSGVVVVMAVLLIPRCQPAFFIFGGSHTPFFASESLASNLSLPDKRMSFLIAANPWPPTPSRAASSTAVPHRLRPARGWTLPNFKLRKEAVDLPAPRIQKFESRVSLPNDRYMTIYSPTPRPNIAISRDTSNHPLWAFPSTSASGQQGGDDDGGRMGRFARKYGGAGAHGSITRGQSQAATDIGAASGGAGNSDQAIKAAIDVVDGKQAEQKSITASQVDLQKSQEEDSSGMFDLSLDGEVVEEAVQTLGEEGKKKSKAK
ncbi:MAG: hypothetical protein CYPHOPRED_004171, partial [Cyphobasidiales sp. Tagirdzhanova-0007]